MCRCKNCEMLSDDVIKVIDLKAPSPLSNDIYHFEMGFRCLYNGVESLNLSDLCKGRCRLGGE